MNQTHREVQRIRAIGLTVSDVDRSQAFYMKALGFRLISDVTVEGQDYSELEDLAGANIRIVTLQLGDELIRLMQYLNLAGKPIPSDSQSNDLWFQHLAIVVSDMASAYDHVRSFLVDPISTAPQTIPLENKTSGGVQAFKFRDPDGHDLELIWFPPDKGKAKWHQRDRLFLGIDHSAIVVADTEQSLHFYQNLLGMKVESSGLNWRPTQASLDNLPNAEVQISSLRPTQDSLGLELLDYLVPGTGRPMPKNWKSNDIAHMQTELVVNNLQQTLDRLQQNGVQLVSSRLVQFNDPASPYDQACLVKDPNGHSILLMTESRSS
jgi:catechol 2,3-dioxygenase-like lactoylglutathione lyase family enzyme